ncbi:hypothetical protein N5079_27420 [Planotetraspora sp. A-T 1434]|uniref:hypothetical protein n=1 Tax=Planotetraspora sp. A-T 1434 TaxID=2979219 RepID=UPI0021C09287|nr:hypothetical protein [Planotetraspora sp. A-T 1434]MCT9933947.1 hypothetical protein [Planotetraspora sp. A-T 1434]
MSHFVDVDALWKVLVAGLLGGAGLAAVYALGLVGLSAYTAEDTGSAARPVGLAVAAACLLIVLVGPVSGSM